MSELAEQLSADLKDAMRAGDTRRRDVIRYLRSAIKNAEIDLRRPLADNEIRDVIRFQIKQRRDSIELFTQGGRLDLATEEEAQIAILQPYLPAQMSDAELIELVSTLADDIGAASMKDMGRLMSVALKAAGDGVESRRVSRFARAELQARSELTPSTSQDRDSP